MGTFRRISTGETISYNLNPERSRPKVTEQQRQAAEARVQQYRAAAASPQVSPLSELLQREPAKSTVSSAAAGRYRNRNTAFEHSGLSRDEFDARVRGNRTGGYYSLDPDALFAGAERLRGTEDYEPYLAAQTARYEDWRGTIRDAGEIEQDLEDLQTSLSALQSSRDRLDSEAMATAYSVRQYGDEVLGGRQRGQQARLEALDEQLAALRERQDLLREELDWSQYFHYADLTQEPDFSGYAAAGARMEQNAITSPRENWRAAALGEMHGVTEGRSIYHWMTDEEADTYNYLLAKEGEGPAQAYLDYLEDELNRRRGTEQAEAVRGIDGPIRRTLMTGAYGITAGLEQGLSGIAQGLTREQLPLPASQYGSAAIQEDLADSPVGRVAYDLTTTAANMLPMMGVSALTAGLGAPAAAAQIAGNATMALSAGGNAYRDALAEGYTEEQARDYSIVSGLSEAGMQYLLGGVSALGGRVTGNIAQRAAENIRHAAGRAAADLGLHMAGEGVEEYLQEILDPALRNLLLDENNEVRLVSEEAAYSLLLGALSAGLMEGGHIAAADINQNRTGRAIRQAQQYETLVENAMAMPEGSEARKTASQLRNGVLRETDGNAGRLFVQYAQEGGDVSFLRQTPAATAQAGSGPAEETPEASNTQTAAKTQTASTTASTASEMQTASPTEAQTAAPTWTAAFQAHTRRQLERAGEALGESGRRALLAGYEDGTDAGSYYAGFSAYYEAGLSGRNRNQVRTAYTGTLTEAQRYAAYTAGQNDAAASLAAEQARAPLATVYGTEAGLIENDLAAALPREEADLYNALGRAAGVKIEIVESLPDADGNMGGGNGRYLPDTGVIQLARDAQDTLPIVAAHEMTHRLQELAPEAYRAYRDYALNAVAQQSGSNVDLVEQWKTRYAAGGVNLTTEQAMDEIAADFTRDMVQDAGLFERLSRENRSLAKRILDGIRDFLRRVKTVFSGRDAQAQAAGAYGVSLAELERAAGLWQEAYDAASGRSSGQRTSAARDDGAARYSIRYDQDNRPYVEVEEDILADVPQSEWVKTVKDNLRQKFPDGVTVGNSLIKINAKSRDEMTFSRYMQKLMKNNRQIFSDKLRSTNHVDEILRAADNWVNEALLHPRKDDVIDFARGEVQIRIGQNEYTAQVIVGNRGNGRLLLYDIINLNPTAIQDKIKKTDAEFASQPHKAGGPVDSSTPTQSVAPASDINSISQTSEDVNDTYSLAAGDLTRENAALQRENRLLREQVEAWKAQTRRTTPGAVDRKAVERLARDLVRTYQADLDASEVAGDLLSLYNYIGTGRDGGSELTYEEARRRADAIARRLVETAVASDPTYEDYAELRRYLRETRLNLSETDRQDIADYEDFRRRNFGRLRLGGGETNVDQVYAELSEQWPEFFDQQAISHPADQLQHIAEVLDTLQQAKETNPFSGYFSAATADASNEILERFFDIPQVRRTFADRQAFTLQEAKAQGRQRLARERERSREQLAELRRQNRERTQQLILGERMAAGRQLAQVRRQYQARDAAGRERRSAAELRRKITRHTAGLSQKLLKPSDKQHIPEQLRGPVAAILDAINQESQYTIDPETGRRRRRNDGLPTRRTEAFQKLREQYEAISRGKTDFTGVLDPSLLDNLSQVIAMRDVRLSEMSRGQLQTVWETVKAVEASVQSANRLFGETRYAGVAQLADGIRQSSRTKRAKRNYGSQGLGAVTSFGDRLLNLDMLNSLTFLHEFGEGGDALYHELQAARDHKTRIMQETVRQVREVIGKTKIAGLQRKRHTFQVEGGELTLTTAQLMSLYELNKRQQAQDHIYKGGIRPTAQETRISRDRSARENLAAALGRQDAPAAGVQVTMEDVSRMLSTLTQEEIALADGLQAIMQGYLADEGNRESMKVYGYRKFTEENYFPITSDPHQVQTKIGDILEGGGNRPVSVAEWGSAKSTVSGANNGLLLGDIFDVFAQHVVDMSTYASHLGVLEDLNRVRNFTFRDSEGNRTGSMGDIIQRVAGSGGNAYLDKLLQDVSRSTARGGVAGLSRLTANYKAASVGLNGRVILQQLMSYPRAAVSMDIRYLAAPRVLRPGGWEKALQYAPIAQWKDWGNFEINQGSDVQDILFGTESGMDKVRDRMMSFASAMDSFTWGRLWNACELEIADTRPGLTAGSEAFYQAVAQRFTDVIDQTQVVDNVLGRSQFMRSSDGLAKMASSYMGEPTQSYNLLYRAYRDAVQEQDPQKRSQARRRMGRAAGSLAFSMLLNAVAQSLWDGIRDDEDREAKYFERVARNILPNLQQNANPMGMVVYARDILSILQGYDVERMDLSAISGLVSAAQNLGKAIDGEGRYTLLGASANLMAELARMVGLPVATVKRDALAIARSVAVETEDWELQYQLERALSNVFYSGNRKEFYDIAFGALADGDLDTYGQIYEDLLSQGVQGSTIENAMRSRLQARQDEDPEFSLSQAAADLVSARDTYAPEAEETAVFSADDLAPEARTRYNTRRADDYRAAADAIEASPGFADLPGEQKDSALEAADRLASAFALEDASDGAYEVTTQWMHWAAGGAGYGVDTAEAILFRTAYEMAESDKDEEGKIISGSKQENTLEIAEDLLPNLTDEELAYLMSLYWMPEDEDLRELKENKFVP